MPGNKDDRQNLPGLRQPALQLKPVETWHRHIQHETPCWSDPSCAGMLRPTRMSRPPYPLRAARAKRTSARPGRRRRGRRFARAALASWALPHRQSDTERGAASVVVGGGDACRDARDDRSGRSRARCPCLLPWCSRMRRTRLSRSRRNPRPTSITYSRTWAPVDSVRIVSSARGQVTSTSLMASAAFRTRFSRTCWSCTGRQRSHGSKSGARSVTGT